MFGAGDVRVERVPDARLMEPTDALVTITRASICGSDLWPYKDMAQTPDGPPHGTRGDRRCSRSVGSEVRTVRVGDFVIMPFAFSDGTCVFCHEGLNTSCVHGGFFGTESVPGAQAEAIRVPQADGTLYVLPGRTDEALMASLLTLSDVMGTGHHAAITARVRRGGTAAVIGDGAVGLCGVIAARRLGAERIILLGRHPDRIALASSFGATDVVSERGAEAIARVRELTGGLGVHSVLECVGAGDAMLTAVNIARAGGAVGRVGVPHYAATPGSEPAFYGNIGINGGPASGSRLYRGAASGGSRGPDRARSSLRPPSSTSTELRTATAR